MNTNTSRRDFLRAIAIAPSIAMGRAVETRPNVLVLHCHDLGRFLNCYGIKTVQTPNLDRLASEGVLLENCFCAAPQCCPSRASMFTGRYPQSNGVMGQTMAPFEWDLYKEEKHLGQILKAEGYSTAGVGIIQETRSGPARIGLDDYSPESRAQAAADEAIRRLERFARSPGQRFYMQVGFTEPHRLPGAKPTDDWRFTDLHVPSDDSLGVTVPLYLRDTLGTRTEIAELQGAVRHTDHHMGRILRALIDLDLESHTLVVFTTDHGIALPRAKCSVYEPGLQVASIWRLPSRPGWHGGIRKREMISNIDYVPTILEAVGLASPANVQGQSFAALLDGGAYTPRQVIFGEMTYHNYYDPVRSIRTETHKLIVNFSGSLSFMDPSQSWRPRCDTVVPANPTVVYHAPLELYDLRDDPGEARNLASLPAYAALLGDLQAQLAKHLKDIGDPILDGAVADPMHRRALEWLKR